MWLFKKNQFFAEIDYFSHKFFLVTGLIFYMT